jgi:hypothetical protein
VTSSTLSARPRTRSAIERRYIATNDAALQMFVHADLHRRRGDDYAAAVCIKTGMSLDDEATRILRHEMPARAMALNALRHGDGVMTPCRSVREARPTVIEQFHAVGKAVALRLAATPTNW